MNENTTVEKKEEIKEEKLKKGHKMVELKVKPSHPAKKFRLGSHVIGQVFAKYELNEAEQKELETAGPKAWLIVGKKA